MKRFIRIEFPISTSKNFRKAIKLAEKFDNFKPAKSEGISNIVDLSKEEFAKFFRQAESLWNLVSSWKGSQLHFEERQVHFSDLYPYLSIIECGRKYLTSVVPEDHCKSFGYKEGWGCKYLDTIHLDLPTTMYHLEGRRTYWFQFGEFISPTVWKINKSALLSALQREIQIKNLSFCPVYELHKAKKVLNELPDTIEISESGSWDIKYEQDTDGQCIEKRPVGVLPKALTGNRSSGISISYNVSLESGVDKEESVNLRFIPSVKFEEIGGVDDILQTIREIIELPLKIPQLYQFMKVKPHKGILLYGPPGCGKTLIAKAIANEVQAHFIAIKGPELISKYHGQSEENLRKVFDEARTLQPSIIFFDEIDSVAQKRSGEEILRFDSRFVNQLLTLMDGVEDYGNVRVIASTNRPDLVDDALRRPGRFDYELEVKKPTRFGCQRIFEIHTRDMPIVGSFDKADFAKQIEGFTGAQIAFVAREGALNCLRRSLNISELITEGSNLKIDYSQLLITKEDFELAAICVKAKKHSYSHIRML